MTLGEIEQTLEQTDHNGFPVIVSTESQYLVGFVIRRDLNLAIKAARNRFGEVPADTAVLFSSGGQLAPMGAAGDSIAGGSLQQQQSDRPPLRFAKIVDLAPVTITDKTPMETVVNMFQKLGLRQTLVTHNGRLLGIITKKDVLRHIKRMDDEDPEDVLFN